MTEHSKQLVFVVGAGASTEFGEFPLGYGLATKIREQLDKDFTGQVPDIVRRLHTPEFMAQSLIRGLDRFEQTDVEVARILRGVLPTHDSIDDAIAEWPDNSAVVRLAKLAIANEISKAEYYSPLSKMSAHDFDSTHSSLLRLQGGWAGSMFRSVGAHLGSRRRDVAERFKDIGFITFNYDRCVEQYIFHALQIFGPTSPSEAIAILSNIPILHVYGALGPHPAMSAEGSVGFGEEKPDIKSMASRIFTYSEEIQEKKNLTAIRSLVARAKKLVFLGFGFHDQNLKVLFGDAMRPFAQRTWATTWQMRPSRIDEVKKLLTNGLGEPLLDSGQCSSILVNHSDDIFNS